MRFVIAASVTKPKLQNLSPVGCCPTSMVQVKFFTLHQHFLYPITARFKCHCPLSTAYNYFFLYEVRTCPSIKLYSEDSLFFLPPLREWHPWPSCFPPPLLWPWRVWRRRRSNPPGRWVARCQMRERLGPSPNWVEKTVLAVYWYLVLHWDKYGMQANATSRRIGEL